MQAGPLKVGKSMFLQETIQGLRIDAQDAGDAGFREFAFQQQADTFFISGKLTCLVGASLGSTQHFSFGFQALERLLCPL